MKKILGILFLILLLSTGSFAGVKKGKGEVEMSNRAVERFITYLRGKKGMKPMAFILSSNGSYTFYWYCAHTGGCRDGNLGPTIRECEEKTGVDCGLFARKRTIVWKNDINPGKGKASKINSKWSDTEVRAKLTELGFLGGSISTTTTTTTKPKTTKKKKAKQIKEAKKENKREENIVKKLKDLKELLDSGVLTKEEFKKAKKKLLN